MDESRRLVKVPTETGSIALQLLPLLRRTDSVHQFTHLPPNTINVSSFPNSVTVNVVSLRILLQMGRARFTLGWASSHLLSRLTEP